MWIGCTFVKVAGRTSHHQIGDVISPTEGEWLDVIAMCYTIETLTAPKAAALLAKQLKGVPI
jgi:hypothetical protein